MKKFLNFIAPFAFMLILNTVLLACSIKKEEPKDDFLGTKTEEKKPETRVHVIDGGSWTVYQIVEVDGHEYLCNNIHGGIVHLESCPCKKKL